MRLGHLGPAGTFTEEAARRSVPGGELVPYASVRETVAAVLAGEVDAALVPIENSLEGSVTTTVDALSAEPELRIVGEVVLAVRQCLIARTEMALDEITEVRSHPQGLAQCARFLNDEVPQATLMPWSSTAEAVRTLAEAPETTAAIASRAAVAAQGGVILREGIDDEPDNETRFAWLACKKTPSALSCTAEDGQPFKTSILFTGTDDGAPGWLVRCLSEFAFRGVNLVKIESRPARRRLGHYVFFADCEGHEDDDAVADAVKGLAAHCDEVRVLGSYKAAPGRSVSWGLMQERA
jgi:prephenate dehydratase